MDEKKIDSVEDLIYILNKYENNHIFRGHANAAWELESSIERMIGNNKIEKFEKFSYDLFESKFHLYDKENITPDSKFAWLSLMQHYGVPTRLLDFTESPYIALYFALESYHPLDNVDLSIFVINYKSLKEASLKYINSKANPNETLDSIQKNQDAFFAKLIDEFDFGVAWVAEPRKFNTRLDRQSGSFLFSSSSKYKIKDVLNFDIYIKIRLYIN